MTSVSSLTFQSLFKNKKLSTAEISWLLTENLNESYYHLWYQHTVLLKISYIYMNLRLKFPLCLNGKLFDFEKASF